MTGPKQYHRVAIGLHWAIAGLILVAFGLGLTVDLFSKRWQTGIINGHALFGLLVLCLSFLRIEWRLTHRVPDLPQTIGSFARVAAAAGHAALYVLMIVVPAIGIPTLLYRGRGLDFIIFQIASPFERTPALFRPLTDYHEIAAFALVALAAGHIIAALFPSVRRPRRSAASHAAGRRGFKEMSEAKFPSLQMAISESDERRAGHPSH